MNLYKNKIEDELTKKLAEDISNSITEQILIRLRPYIVYSILLSSYNKNKNVDSKKLYRILDEIPWNEVNIF